MSTGTRPAPPDGSAGAAASRGGGHAAYYCLVTVAVSAAVVLVDDGGDRWLAVLTNALLLGLYFLLCQPSVAGRHENAPPALAYAAVAAVGVALTSYVAPNAGSFILFAICPQLAVALSFAVSAPVVIALNALFAGSSILGGSSPGPTVVSAVGVAAGVTYFVYRSWIRDTEAEERAALITELHETREQAAEMRAGQAVVEDRMRISRDMHDTVAQGFASILLLVQALEAEIDDRPGEARRHAGMVKRIAAENLEESRRIVSAFAPAPLDELTLDAALRDLVRRFTDETAVEATLHVRGTPHPLERPVQVVALRLCQEALANVRKHAAAHSVCVEIGYDTRSLAVRVVDDGSGFDGRSYGYGLRGLVARVREIGGVIEVDSAPGRGTTRARDAAGVGNRARRTVIRVVLVDDHPLLREGIASMLAPQPDMEVVGQASSGPEGVALALALRPDIVLMDLRMPGGDGVDATAALRAQLPTARVVVLTTYDSDADILRAVDAGAAGYLLKDISTADLAAAIRTAHAGGTVLAPSAATAMMNRLQSREPGPSELSSRELQVLIGVAAGRTNAAIGRDLHIGEATVKTYLARVYDKLGVRDRASAVAAASRLGLLR